MKSLKYLVVSFGGLLILWQLIAVAGIFPKSLFPSPLIVGEALINRAVSGKLFLDLGASMYRFFIGYLYAVIVAVLAGLLLGWFFEAWNFLNPIVQFLRPISPMAWLPFIVLWVGIGDLPAIVIIFLAAFFPVLLTTVTAVRQVDEVYLKVAKNFGLSRSQTLFQVVFPAAFPQIAGGLHMALGTAWIFLVAGEMVGAQSGLGYLIIDARNNLQADMLMVAIIVIGVLGLILDLLIRYFEEIVREHWGFGVTNASSEG